MLPNRLVSIERRCLPIHCSYTISSRGPHDHADLMAVTPKFGAEVSDTCEASLDRHRNTSGFDTNIIFDWSTVTTPCGDLAVRPETLGLRDEDANRALKPGVPWGKPRRAQNRLDEAEIADAAARQNARRARAGTAVASAAQQRLHVLERWSGEQVPT